MANAKSIRADSPLKVLIYGPSGTKKTTLAASFPNPHFVDLDNGMRVLMGKDINYVTLSEKETTDPDFLSLCGPKAGKLDAYNKAATLLEKWANSLTAKDTLILDSLSLYTDYALAYVLRTERQDKPRIQDWGSAQKLIELTIEALTKAECNVVVIAHEGYEKNEDGAITLWAPATIGKLSMKMPLYFDEVWRSACDHRKVLEGGKTVTQQVYTIETAPTKKSTAKSRSNLPTTVEEPTYEKVIKLIADRR